MNFSYSDVTRHTRTGSFLNQVDYLIDWRPIDQAIKRHYAPVSDVTGRPVYRCLDDDIPDHSVLSRFRTRLTTAQA